MFRLFLYQTIVILYFAFPIDQQSFSKRRTRLMDRMFFINRNMIEWFLFFFELDKTTWTRWIRFIDFRYNITFSSEWIHSVHWITLSKLFCFIWFSCDKYNVWLAVYVVFYLCLFIFVIERIHTLDLCNANILIFDIHIKINKFWVRAIISSLIIMICSLFIYIAQ